MVENIIGVYLVWLIISVFIGMIVLVGSSSGEMNNKQFVVVIIALLPLSMIGGLIWLFNKYIWNGLLGD